MNERNELVFKCWHRVKNSNYPDWEPLKHQFLRNCKDNDKDLLEIINNQFSSGYHWGGEI